MSRLTGEAPSGSDGLEVERNDDAVFNRASASKCCGYPFRADLAE
jgi:hypothetical protein